MKVVIPVFFFFVLVGVVLAAPPSNTPVASSSLGLLELEVPFISAVKLGTNHTFHTHVYSYNGTSLIGNNASCNIHIYNSTSGNHIVRQNMVPDGTEYEYVMNNSIMNTKGYYPYVVSCNATIAGVGTGGFYQSVFEVTPTGYPSTGGESLAPVAVTILLPLLLSLVLLLGAAALDSEKHAPLKIAAFLLSIVPFFASMNFAALAMARYYDFTPFGDTIGTTTYWVGISFAVIVAYFIIYAFYVIIQNIRAKKEERLRY